MMNQRAYEKEGRLPDFVVIGAAKAGTTSLDYYLSLHPDIHMAKPKEPRFFVDLPEKAGRWSRGLDWYKSLFVTRKKICGEASPQYVRLAGRNGIPARMFSIIPAAKLIFLVREPYQRLVSNYKMAYRLMMTDGSLAEYIETEPLALDPSCYGSRMQEFLCYYPRDQIMVVESTQLRDNRAACLASIFSFIGVDSTFRSSRFNREHHVAENNICPSARGRALFRSKPVRFLQRHLSDWSFYHVRNLLMFPFDEAEPPTDLPADVERALRERFKAEMALLRKLTGQPLPSLGP